MDDVITVNPTGNVTEKKNDSKCCETRKKDKTGDAEFSPVPAANQFCVYSMLIQATIQHFNKIYQ